MTARKPAVLKGARHPVAGKSERRLSDQAFAELLPLTLDMAGYGRTQRAASMIIPPSGVRL